MIFLPSGVSFTLWQAAYSATFGLRGWPVPLTPKAKRYSSSCNFVGDNAHEEILLRCAQKSNHLTNHTDCLCVNSISLLLITLLHLITLLFSVVV